MWSFPMPSKTPMRQSGKENSFERSPEYSSSSCGYTQDRLSPATRLYGLIDKSPQTDTDAHPAGSPKGAAAVVQTRSVPFMFILGPQQDILLHGVGSDEIDGLTRRDQTGLRELSVPLLRLVRAMIRELRRDGRGRMNAFLDSDTVVRLTPLEGVLDGCVAVLVEKMKSRDATSRFVNRYSLTRRESEVLHYLIIGTSTREIAGELGISPSTIILHIRSLLQKTGSHTRTEMIGKLVSDPLP